MINFWFGILFTSTLIHECDVLVGGIHTDKVSQFGLKFVLAFNKIPITEPYLFLITNETKVAMVKISKSEPNTGNLFELMVSKVSNKDVTIVQLEQTQIPYPRKDVGSHGCVVLQSDVLFGLHVILYGFDMTMASYLALPTTSWGRRYHLVTLHSKVYVTVISEDETVVKFRLHSIPPDVFNLIYNDNKFAGTNLLMVWLRNLEAFTISTCSLNSVTPKFSLTGSLVESQYPIVVITGTCSHVMEQGKCPNKKQFPDISVEMMYPQYMFGVQFVVMTLVHRVSRELLVALTSLPDTNITVVIPHITQNEIHVIKEARSIYYLNAFNKQDLFVFSSKLIMLYMIITSSCLDELDLGGPSITTVLPVALWFSGVSIWRTFPFPNTTHYVVLACFAWDLDFVRINTRKLSQNKCQAQPLIGSNGFAPFTCTLPTDEFIIVESVKLFTCYFYGLGFGAYVSSGGFQGQEGRKLECIYSQPTTGDKIDNDCDGKVDEEIIDLKDNDNDGLCDEDFEATDVMDSFIWGVNCSQNCTGCQHRCSPLDGYCDTCRPGYKGHLSGCQFECEEFEYGVNCNGDCYEKCGSDCQNRENGRCPETQSIAFFHHGFVYLGILVFFAAAYHCLCHPKKRTYRGSETETDSNITRSFNSRQM